MARRLAGGMEPAYYIRESSEEQAKKYGPPRQMRDIRRAVANLQFRILERLAQGMTQ